MKLSTRAQTIKPSATLTIAAKARALSAQGKKIISMSTGEPDFDTPQHIKAAAEKAIAAGYTKYTPVDGIPELKQAIIKKLQTENGLYYSSDEIIVSNGAKQSIFNTCLALLDEQDEVLIPAPFWVSYPDMVQLCDAVPVIIPTHWEQFFKITAAQLEQYINDKTKLLILNSPSNPSGVTYTQQELKELAQVLLKYPHVMILTDDIYEGIYWASEPFHNILMVCPELRERTILVNGVSKTYAMTGWRIGYTAANKALSKAMNNIQSQSTSNPCSIAQYAAVEALNGPQDCVKEMCAAFKARHDYFIHALNQLSGVRCQEAQGAFYAFPEISESRKKLGLKNDLEYAEFLLEKAEIAVVPGSAFGCEDTIRLSYATSMEVLEETIKRLQKIL